MGERHRDLFVLRRKAPWRRRCKTPAGRRLPESAGCKRVMLSALKCRLLGRATLWELVPNVAFSLQFPSTAINGHDARHLQRSRRLATQNAHRLLRAPHVPIGARPARSDELIGQKDLPDSDCDSHRHDAAWLNMCKSDRLG